MIDFDFYNSVIPKKGSLLLSNPELPDRIFHRSVILLCEHDKNGTLGFILNKKSMTQVSEALESLDEIDEKLHYGGPVDMNGLYIIHRANIPNRINVLNGIFYGGDVNSLSSLFNTKQIDSNDIKFFLGYSSWIPNQLTFELKRRSW
ncbi:MAG: YqgE/AlgH family protein, partial [Candidatus Heimdallarchaeota archaeon]